MPTPPPSSTSQSPHDSTPPSSSSPTPSPSTFHTSPAASPSDIPRLRTTHSTAGYRAGITASKASTLQAGFDEGYPLGAAFGLRVGWVLGVLEGLHTALTKGGGGGGGGSSLVGRGAGAGDQEGGRMGGKGARVRMEVERERVWRMVKDAREELGVERVFGGGGSWGYGGLGEEGEEGRVGGEGEGKREDSREGNGEEEVIGEGWGKGEVMFKEVVEGHPVVREWVGRVRGEMERWGIREDGGFGGAEWEAGRVEYGEGGGLRM